ncbi:3-hydroxyacyl-CoA dehydrogenase NAD-binding domain-containing protein [Aquicoccus sp.]|uniref:3-hydroxyacyl-CoA dehydrogenase NAD-binding domain-containing protein n=1 Tax=Aquicoccus sp. TaxID=2055851 RepID=UPI0035616228
MQIEAITIVGGGLIGASWAALFLAHGVQVTVQDVAEGFEARLTDEVGRAWPDLVALGAARVDLPLDRLCFASDTARACKDADFIQECGPDRLEVKREIISRIEAGARADTVIASSTSSLLASDIQQGAHNPERILVAHPFNPPHLVPLVELVPGRQTEAEAMGAARAFYESIGREVVELKRDVVGHVANRLSSALFREAVHIVAEGIASAEDVDRALMNGPGLRWALMGPYLTYHLGGGAGGFRHYMEHLGPTQAARWADLGEPELDPETINTLIEGVNDLVAGLGDVDPVARRDAGLIGLLELKRRIDSGDGQS